MTYLEHPDEYIGKLFAVPTMMLNMADFLEIINLSNQNKCRRQNYE